MSRDEQARCRPCDAAVRVAGGSQAAAAGCLLDFERGAPVKLSIDSGRLTERRV
jgi:hypothetical protein